MPETFDAIFMVIALAFLILVVVAFPFSIALKVITMTASAKAGRPSPLAALFMARQEKEIEGPAAPDLLMQAPNNPLPPMEF